MNHFRHGIIILIIGLITICGLFIVPSFAAGVSQTNTQITSHSIHVTSSISEIPLTDDESSLNSDENTVTTQTQSNPVNHWNSGTTSLSKLTTDQKKKVNSLIKKPINQSVKDATPPITVPSHLPQSFDWRNNGGDWTTSVKNQGEQCGSCWAFASIGILESYMKITNHNPSLNVGLAEQYLISCDSDDDGCDGGDFETAIPYLVDKPGPDGKVGTVPRADYQYSEETGSCKDLSDYPRYHADKWAYVNETGDAENSLPTVDELKAAIYLKGPIAVGVEDDDAFDNYDGGIFSSDTIYDETNHAVILVGWGIENGEDYFIGKNSVGTDWGEDGWFRIDVHSNRIGEGAVYLDSTKKVPSKAQLKVTTIPVTKKTISLSKTTTTAHSLATLLSGVKHIVTISIKTPTPTHSIATLLPTSTEDLVDEATS